MPIYLLTAINIISIFICHYMAISRGKKPVFWGVMGAIFGPFAIPVLLLTKNKTKINMEL